MQYRLRQKRNPQQPDAPQKYYAVRVKSGNITQHHIEEKIVDLSSLSAGDVANSMKSLLTTIPEYLLDGKSVVLDDLGTFRLSFSSAGVDNPKDFNAKKMITRTRVIFTPSKKLRKKLEDVEYTRV